MAEIKSTLELALERTRKMSLTEEEKEKMKQKEIAQKATGMFHRYAGDHASLNEIQREIGRMEEKAGAAVREMLLSRWIEALSVDDGSEKILRGIEALKGRSVDEARRRLVFLRSEYEREKQDAERRIEARLKEALRKEGIYGSAVAARIKGSKEWEDTLGVLGKTFGGKIEEMKGALKKR